MKRSLCILLFVLTALPVAAHGGGKISRLIETIQEEGWSAWPEYLMIACIICTALLISKLISKLSDKRRSKAWAKDPEERIRVLRELSEEEGNEFASFDLGNYYANGELVTKDLDEAAKWYRKAAEQGHKKAKKALKKIEFY